jgi:hypothetical protein
VVAVAVVAGLMFWSPAAAALPSLLLQDEFGYDQHGSNAALDRPPNSPVPPKRTASDIISFRRVALDAPDGMPLVRKGKEGGGREHACAAHGRIYLVWGVDSRQAPRSAVAVCLPAADSAQHTCSRRLGTAA